MRIIPFMLGKEMVLKNVCPGPAAAASPGSSFSQFSRSVVSDSLQPMNCSTLSFPVHHQLPELAQTHVHRVGDAIQPSHPLSSPSHAFNLSQHQDVFQRASSLHQWPKYWSFSFSISPFNEYSELISQHEKGAR